MTSLSRNSQQVAVQSRRLVLGKFGKNANIQSTRNGGSFYQSNNFDGYGDSVKHQLKTAPRIAATWRNIFFIGAIPSMLAAMWLAYNDHLHEHDKPRKKYVEYPYLNCRTKPFPWGDGNHTLFHNPERNYVPGVGFEKEPSHH